MAEAKPATIKPPLQQKAPAPEPEPAAEPELAPESEVIEEVVNMGGLVMKKTMYPDGECETEVLSQPMISRKDIAATRAMQKARGR